MTYTADQRTMAVETVLEGLSKGTPLTVLCSAEDMPGIRTFYEWMAADVQLSADIARAREAGWDAIAIEALRIADHSTDDTVKTESGDRPNTEWITRSRLRVDTRLKLLAKWDPKRYGDLIKLGDPLGDALTININKPGVSSDNGNSR